jgi:hypothetical protein
MPSAHKAFLRTRVLGIAGQLTERVERGLEGGGFNTPARKQSIDIRIVQIDPQGHHRQHTHLIVGTAICRDQIGDAKGDPT